jgi:hypothetical protein
MRLANFQQASIELSIPAQVCYHGTELKSPSTRNAQMARDSCHVRFTQLLIGMHDPRQDLGPPMRSSKSMNRPMQSARQALGVTCGECLLYSMPSYDVVSMRNEIDHGAQHFSLQNGPACIAFDIAGGRRHFHKNFSRELPHL